MLILSIVTQLGLMAAYLVNGRIPFSYPISLLGDSHERVSYHVALGLFSAAWAWYLVHCWRARLGIEMLLTPVIGVALLALQFHANEDEGHDGLAAILMILVCLLTVRISSRLESSLGMAAALASFACCSVVFSGNLLIVGLAKNLVLAVALGVLSWDCRVTPADHAPRSRLRPSSYRRPSALTSWPPGVAAGLAWGLFCCLVVGLAGLGDHQLLAGPVVTAITWFSGYLAWRRYMPFWQRAILLTATVIGAVMVVGNHPDLGTLIVALIPVGTVLLMMLLVEIYNDP
jgi:hypothetical protein